MQELIINDKYKVILVLIPSINNILYEIKNKKLPIALTLKPSFLTINFKYSTLSLPCLIPSIQPSLRLKYLSIFLLNSSISVDKISATMGIISVIMIFNCIPTIPIVDSILINVFATMIDKEYIQFNRFCGGKYVSISSIVDYKFLMDIIVKHKKYGYICDITDDKESIINMISVILSGEV